MIKKIMLGLIGVGLSSSVYAAYPADVLPVAPPTVNVTIPQQVGSWTFGIEGLYQEVVNSDFHYATGDVFVTNANATFIDAKTHDVAADWNWGAKLDIMYSFPGNGRDVKLAYTFYSYDTSSSQRRPGGTQLFGPSLFSPGFLAASFPDGWDEAKGSSRLDYNALDLVFGQNMNFGQRVNLRAFGGLRWADIDGRDKATYAAAQDDGAGNIDAASANFKLKSHAWGIGPRAGFDAKVHLGSNFSIVGTFAGSLLIGTLEEKLTGQLALLDASANMTDTYTVAAKVSDSTRVIPELDARIGLNYTYNFDPQMAISGELGWEVTNYFGAKGNSFGSYIDSVSHNSDVAIQGPYLRLQLEVA